jgi:hypothetical protein
LSLSIEFERIIAYDKGVPAIYVRLIGAGGEDEALAVFDTGAQYSLFKGVRAPGLGISLLEGRRISLSSLGGTLQGYLHRIEIEIEGFRFPVDAVFSLNHIPREILGRHTLFEQVTWGLRESQQEIYFSPKP